MFVLPGLCISELLVSLTNNSAYFSQSARITKIPGGRFTGIGFAMMGAAFGVLSLAALFGLLG